MITYIEGNLFLSTAQSLVNTVNTVGVMGKGIAKEFKQLYPAMFEEYKRHCDAGTLEMGSLLLYRTVHKWILNVPTKRHWKQASRLGDIEQALATFQRTYAEQGITSIAFPQLGCGHGGLDWESQVRPLMERYLGALPIDVFIHIPAKSEDAIVTREQFASWLAAPLAHMPFTEFRHDVLTHMKFTGGALSEAAQYPHTLCWHETADEPDVLFDLWRRLSSSGYLLPEDVSLSLGHSAEPFFAQLAKLPYVKRARVVRPPFVSYDGNSTDSLFGLPGAQGVQFVPPFAAGRVLPQAPIDVEGALPCSANPTQGQLALFSTS